MADMETELNKDMDIDTGLVSDTDIGMGNWTWR
jgi:hypothetical protein